MHRTEAVERYLALLANVEGDALTPETMRALFGSRSLDDGDSRDDR